MIQIKICGITRLEDALAAENAGADAVGFVFFARSKRCVEPRKAGAISAALKPFTARVGVFVNATVEEINKTILNVGLTHVQLHGQERPEMRMHINRPVVRAVHWNDQLEAQLEAWQDTPLMVDSGNRDNPGGTGIALPWEEIPGRLGKRPFILAGGLNAQNVAQAVAATNPVAVDVSSGVEKEPGIKDHEKIIKFISEVKSAFRNRK